MSDTELPGEISVTDVDQMRKNDAVFKLVDVRTQRERDVASIEESHLLDQSLFDEMKENWGSDMHIVTYCHTGVRSLQAAQFLNEHGFTRVQSMMGGIAQWSITIDPSVPQY